MFHFAPCNPRHHHELAEQERALRKREHLYQVMFAAAPLVLWMIDKDGIFTLAEGGALARMGSAPGEIVGQSVFELYRDNRDIVENIQRALAGEPISYITTVQDIFFEIRLTPLRTADGRSNGVIGVAFEAAERMGIESVLQDNLMELVDVHERLSNLETLKSDMIRMAAHDLRSPLHDMIGFTELLLEDKDQLQPKHAEFLGYIRQSQERMLGIINNILSLQRIEAMENHIHYESVDLTALVAEVFAFDAPAAQQRQQRLLLEMSDTALCVRGDPIQLREAVHNLIGNAIKYTPEDGTITVRLLYRPADRVLFEVQDTGCGIPEDRQARLGEPFYRVRTSENRHIEGNGLGLSLVKRIVERHGGQMRFRSKYQVGSTFGFELMGAKMPVNATF